MYITSKSMMGVAEYSILHHLIMFVFIDAGNANFKMSRICLTLCGMTQPATAALLIVDKNADKGLASRFLWIFPKPVFHPFSALEVSVNEEHKEAAENFTTHLGNKKF